MERRGLLLPLACQVSYYSQGTQYLIVKCISDTENSNTTVAVIEAGGDGSEHADNINIPGYSYLNGLPGTDADWAYKTTNQPNAANRVNNWPRGKVLGGSGVCPVTTSFSLI